MATIYELPRTFSRRLTSRLKKRIDASGDAEAFLQLVAFKESSIDQVRYMELLFSDYSLTDAERLQIARAANDAIAEKIIRLNRSGKPEPQEEPVALTLHNPQGGEHE